MSSHVPRQTTEGAPPRAAPDALAAPSQESSASANGPEPGATSGERTAAGPELTEAERLALALEAACLGDWAWRADGDELTLSARAARLLRSPGAGPLRWAHLFEPAARPDGETARRAVEAALADHSSFAVEYRIPADGRTRWVSLTGRGCYDAQGRTIGAVGLVQDVTERSEVARSREEYLRAIVDATPECVKIVGRDGRVLEMNASGLQMLEAEDPRAVVGASVFDLVAPEYRERWLEAHARVCAGETVTWEFEIVGLKGRRRLMETHAVPLPLPDGQRVHLGVTRDITDRRWAEQERDHLLEAERAARSEAERASRLKDEFLATLSHELRTPLNAILGWAHMLREGDRGPSEIRRGLDVIARNARVQTQIVDDLLDMSRIISGKIRLDVQPVPVARVVESAIETARPAADGRDIQLRAMIDPLAGVVAGDPDRLQQVFWNLLSNAIKFTPKGGRVQIVVERADSQIQVAVHDTGEGIAPEFLPYVFDRFRQIDSSTTRRHGGLGLGLSIVKQLVEMHGGTVRAESEGVGRGARFVVTLPVTAARVPASPDRERYGAFDVPLDPTPRLDGVQVLVVDDEREAAELTARVLEDAGATVAIASSVEEALEAVTRGSYDVLVSDIGMPGADGYTLMRRVRALDGAPRDVPALALTAYARPQDRRKALLSGYQMHAAKPVDPSELVLMVASLAGRTRELTG